MTGLCIFMTLLNVLATPEQIIKIYSHKKKLCNFNHTLIERKHKNENLFPVYEIQNSNFYRVKIAVSLDLIKIY